MPPWSAPISTPRVPAMRRPRTSRREAGTAAGRPSTGLEPAPEPGRPAPRPHRGLGRMTTNPPPARASVADREALGRSRGGLTTKIHLLADSPLPPVARVTTAGQRHDSLAFEPLMDRLRIRRPGRGRPRTRPGWLLGRQGILQPQDSRYLRRRRIKATIPEQPTRSDPRRQGLPRRAATGLRPRGLQAAQHRRARTQQAQGFPRSGHAHRQTRLHLPRHRRRRHDQDLAPRPSPSKIQQTRPSPPRSAISVRGGCAGASAPRASATECLVPKAGTRAPRSRTSERYSVLVIPTYLIAA